MLRIAEQAERLAALRVEHVAVPEDRFEPEPRVLRARAGREQQHPAAGVQPGQRCLVEAGVTRTSAGGGSFRPGRVDPEVPVVLERLCPFNPNDQLAGLRRGQPSPDRPEIRPKRSALAQRDGSGRRTRPCASVFPSADTSFHNATAFSSGAGPKCATSTSAVKRLVGGPDALEHARQRDGRVAEPAEFRRGDVALGFPERVEHADQRRALPGKVVQVEQLEAADARRAQRGLDFLLVAERLELAGGAQEIAPLVQHPVLGQRIAEDLEVLRLERAGVFADLVEVRIHAPLAHLMHDDRHAQGLARLVR